MFCLQVHPGGRRLLVQCRSLSHPVAMIDLKLNAIMQTFSGCQSFKRQVNPSVCLFVSLFVSFFCFFFFVSFDARPQVKLDHADLLRVPKFQTTGKSFCFFVSFFVSFDDRPQAERHHADLLRLPKFQTTG
jgi:hypothetical protein